MKTIKILLLSIVAMSIFSFTILNNNPNFQEDLENIGVIKQSLLKPIQFNKTQKGVWVVLKGQEISRESELFKLLEENSDLNILTKKDNQYFLPDARGSFIRSSNINGEGRDTEENRLVGSFQDDAFQGHKHINSEAIGQFRGKETNNTPHQRYTITGTPASNSAGTINGGYGNPRISTETRPKNISMYTYIKIASN